MIAPLIWMLRKSPTSVTQLSIDLVNQEFGGNDCGENKAKILSAFFVFKDPTGVGYLTSNTKKTFNFLWHTFTQTFIF